MVNGVTEATIGELGGGAIEVLPQRQQAFLRIATQSHVSAGTSTHTLYSFDGTAYAVAARRVLVGQAQNSLVAAWRALPAWRPDP